MLTLHCTDLAAMHAYVMLYGIILVTWYGTALHYVVLYYIVFHGDQNLLKSPVMITVLVVLIMFTLHNYTFFVVFRCIS